MVGNLGEHGVALGRDAVLRLDYLMLSPAVAARLIAAGVGRGVRAREKTSDHAPTWIELTDTQ